MRHTTPGRTKILPDYSNKNPVTFLLALKQVGSKPDDDGPDYGQTNGGSRALLVGSEVFERADGMIHIFSKYHLDFCIALCNRF